MGMVAVVGATAFAFLRLPSQAGGLPEVRLGVDKCAYCGMIIVDVRFAALYYDGRRWEKFDDVLCLLDFLRAVDKLGDFGNAYVHDYVSGAVVKASDAYYIINKQIPTPMGSGILAFADRNTASKYGKVLTATELINKYQQERV